MAEDGAHGPIAAHHDDSDVFIFDPVAWEARVSEARARRSEALARRANGSPAKTASAPQAPEPLAPVAGAPLARSAEPSSVADVAPVEEDAGPATLRADVYPAELRAIREPRADTARPRRRGRVGFAAAFLTGLGIGLICAFALPGPVQSRVQALLAPRPGIAPSLPATQALASLAAPDPARAPPGLPAPAMTPPAAAAITPLAPLPSDPLPAASGGEATPVRAADAVTPPATPPDRAADPRVPAAVADPAPLRAPPEALAAAPAPDAPPAAVAPARAPAAAMAAAPEVAAPGPDAAPIPEVAPPGPAGARLRVVVHVPNGVPDDAAAEAITALRAQGYAVEGPVPVRLSVSRTHTRYFHAVDAAAAADAARAAARGEAEAEARDFTHITAASEPGTIELWLGGTPVASGSGNRASRPRAGAGDVLTEFQKVMQTSTRQVAADVRRSGKPLRKLQSRIDRTAIKLDSRIRRAIGAPERKKGVGPSRGRRR